MARPAPALRLFGLASLRRRRDRRRALARGAAARPVALPPFSRRKATAARQSDSPPTLTRLCGACCSDGAPSRWRGGSEERWRGGLFPAGCCAARRTRSSGAARPPASGAHPAAGHPSPADLRRRCAQRGRRVVTSAAALARRATATARRGGSVPSSRATRRPGRSPGRSVSRCGDVGGQAALVLVRGRGARARSLLSLSLSSPPSRERERPETESETGDMIFVKKIGGKQKGSTEGFLPFKFSGSSDQRISGSADCRHHVFCHGFLLLSCRLWSLA